VGMLYLLGVVSPRVVWLLIRVGGEGGCRHVILRVEWSARLARR
jgi:hypothetical protein